MNKRMIKGELCCSIGDAAKYLNTNTKTIKQMIGDSDGKIKLGPQPRINCQKLYVRVDSLVQVKYSKNEI